MFLKETIKKYKYISTYKYIILSMFQNTKSRIKSKNLQTGKFEVKEDPKFITYELNHSYSFNNGARNNTSAINCTI